MPSSSQFIHARHTQHPFWRERFEIQPTSVITEVEHGTATGTAEGDSIPLLLAPNCSRRVLFLQDPTLQSKHELRVFLSTGKALFEVCWLNINFLLKINRIKWSLQAYGHQGSYSADALVAQRSRMWGMGSCRIHVAPGGNWGLFPTLPEGPWVPSVLCHSILLPRNRWGRWNLDEILVKILVSSHLRSALSAHCLQISPTCPFPTSQNEFHCQQEPCKYPEFT